MLQRYCDFAVLMGKDSICAHLHHAVPPIISVLLSLKTQLQL